MSTMLNSANKGQDSCQGSSFDADILGQGFSQLSAEGRVHLKDFLENLVSMQNTMTGTITVNDARSSSNDSLLL